MRPTDVASVLSSWDGELCSVRHDRETGAWSVVAVHSTRLGPASGGTRAMVYPSLDEAVGDAARLARAMTTKMAAAGLPMGGGKSVIALPAPRAALGETCWRRILRIHAEHVQTFGGSYTTGPDIGTSAADMDVLRETTPFAFGRSVAAGGPGSGAPATALGVVAAVRAAVTHAGLGDVAGLRVLVQGLGAVGARVAQLVAGAGAQVLVTDLDPARCGGAEARGMGVVTPGAATRTPCDVLVPCATGGLLDEEVAATVPCAVVAGAANNQLADAAAAAVLAARGVVYAPDFVANAGGAIHLVGREVLGWTAEQVARRTEGIGATLTDVFADARSRGVTTAQAADDLAARRLAAATVPGPARDQRGAFVEPTRGDAEPITVTGARRTFLLDGDEVVMTATAPGSGGGRVGFGEVRGRVVPAGGR